MNIEKVTYKEIFPIVFLGELTTYVNAHICVEVAVGEGENAKLALQTAKDLVHEFYNDAHKETADYIKSISAHRELKVVAQSATKPDAEFETLKEKLLTFEIKADAEAYLESTSFRHAIAAKQFINSNFK